MITLTLTPLETKESIEFTAPTFLGAAALLLDHIKDSEDRLPPIFEALRALAADELEIYDFLEFSCPEDQFILSVKES
jgi:hypothetical protein